MTNREKELTDPKRRKALQLTAGLFGASMLPGIALASAAGKAQFPRGFLWGAAVAAHQVEGDNTNSDAWVLENVKPTLFAERSLSAIDHYRLFDSDIALASRLGLNTFRFSIEWARIEPEEGVFSRSALNHYRDVLQSCRRRNMKAMVSFNHFTAPAWFAGKGGFESEDAPELFARYCDYVSKELGHLMAFATTFNEPNFGHVLFAIPSPHQGMAKTPVEQEMLKAAARRVGTDRFSAWAFGNYETMQASMVKAHKQAYAAIKKNQPALPVGLSLSMLDEQAVDGGEAMRDRKLKLAYEPWFDAVNAAGDFFGVQNYGRSEIGPEGERAPTPNARMTSMHTEFYPQGLEATLRYAATKVKVPLYVTENGIATDNDEDRVEYLRLALRGVANCIADQVNVRGYVHWSLMDNFEWIFGYKPRFGLIAVDPVTMARRVKPSAYVLGKIAQQNRL